MDEQTEDKKIQKGLEMISMSLSVSKKEFRDYFQQLETDCGEMICPLCKASLWGVPSREDSKEHPAIITLPLPNSSGRGMWAYPVICTVCGYVATFATNHVASKIKGS